MSVLIRYLKRRGKPSSVKDKVCPQSENIIEIVLNLKLEMIW